ncbi:MAG TPA: hypothetical protein VEB63_02910 [Chitinophagaceae bacterium]|nr:hypothetical protein [Chitinophagaceae bacterium]
MADNLNRRRVDVQIEIVRTENGVLKRYRYPYSSSMFGYVFQIALD